MPKEQFTAIHVTVLVEYCGVCDYGGHCLRVAKRLRDISNDFDVICKKGRKGSFEVTVNGVLIYSKLQTKSLPDYDQVVKRAILASEGKPVTAISVQQPINCVIS